MYMYTCARVLVAEEVTRNTTPFRTCIRTHIMTYMQACMHSHMRTTVSNFRLRPNCRHCAYIHTHIHTKTHTYMHMYAHYDIHTCLCPSIYLSFYLSVYLWICIFLIFYLFFYLSIYLCIHKKYTYHLYAYIQTREYRLGLRGAAKNIHAAISIQPPWSADHVKKHGFNRPGHATGDL